MPVGGGKFTTFFSRAFTTLGNDAAKTARLFKPVAERLSTLSDASFLVFTSQKAFTDYGSYYENKTKTDATVGGVSAMGSRLLGESALEGNRTGLRNAMKAMAGLDGKTMFQTIVHHGLQTAPETRDKLSAAQPGW
ncbi:hypothetical protein CCHL11_00074 [Colletotrichum chlorophyti]|uniref:Uncharacterized protein n=1 Tax=Colletotrichum chlorophyti TaxID=708187 RepID=A0A1Q8RV33_9PEZI|nr:hypothetical protein CCHL11_00074 [Colletotrichum chlorophyti]